MNREEILEISRKENKNRDEMEQRAFETADQKACAVGGIVCAVIALVEGFFGDGFNAGLFAIYLSITGTMLVGKYRTLGKKHELISGVIQLLLAAAFLVMHMIGIFSNR